jgi:N-methylhydantoinase B
LRGGLPGAAGGLFLNDRPVPDKLPLTLHRGDVLRLEVPGSGGMYPPALRADKALARDVADGIVTPEAALRDYREGRRETKSTTQPPELADAAR